MTSDFLLIILDSTKFVNDTLPALVMLLVVSAPQFKEPVTTVGPVIVVFVALTTKAFDPEVADIPLLVTRPRARTVAATQFTLLP